MITHYHEMSALLGVGQPGKPVVLNDLHKAAWSLYTGTGKMEIPQSVERPFTFRADALPGRPGMYLFTVRSPFAFAHAKQLCINLEAGASLDLEFMISPFKRVKNAQDKSRRIVPPEGEWEETARQRFRAAGMEPGGLSLTPLPKMSMRHHQVRHPLLVASSTVTVVDPTQAAELWLRGATPMRAYGLGQLTLLPSSKTQATAA